MKRNGLKVRDAFYVNYRQSNDTDERRRDCFQNSGQRRSRRLSIHGTTLRFGERFFGKRQMDVNAVKHRSRRVAVINIRNRLDTRLCWSLWSSGAGDLVFRIGNRWRRWLSGIRAHLGEPAEYGALHRSAGCAGDGNAQLHQREQRGRVVVFSAGNARRDPARKIPWLVCFDLYGHR